MCGVGDLTSGSPQVVYPFFILPNTNITESISTNFLSLMPKGLMILNFFPKNGRRENINQNALTSFAKIKRNPMGRKWIERGTKGFSDIQFDEDYRVQKFNRLISYKNNRYYSTEKNKQNIVKLFPQLVQHCEVKDEWEKREWKMQGNSILQPNRKGYISTFLLSLSLPGRHFLFIQREHSNIISNNRQTYTHTNKQIKH